MSGTLNVSTTDILALAAGFNSIVIGYSTGTNAIVVTSAVTFTSPVTIQTPTGGSITVNDQIMGTGLASITLIGSGHTTYLNANIVTAGSADSISKTT